MEKNIICSHMFPIGGKVPKYLESVIVDIIDDLSKLINKEFSYSLENIE